MSEDQNTINNLQHTGYLWQKSPEQILHVTRLL